MIHNDLHLEIGKFKTFNISQSEIIDLGMRYALGKQEFRRMAAEVIERKAEDNKSKINNSGKNCNNYHSTISTVLRRKYHL